MRETKTIVTETCDRCGHVVKGLKTLYRNSDFTRTRDCQHTSMSDLCEPCWSDLLVFLEGLFREGKKG